MRAPKSRPGATKKIPILQIYSFPAQSNTKPAEMRNIDPGKKITSCHVIKANMFHHVIKKAESGDRTIKFRKSEIVNSKKS